MESLKETPSGNLKDVMKKMKDTAFCFCFLKVSVGCLYSHLGSLWLGFAESLGDGVHAEIQAALALT